MKTGEFIPNALIAGDFPRITDGFIPLQFTQGALVPRGAIIKADGAPATETDTPYGILAEDVQMASAQMPCVIFLSGEFIKRKITVLSNGSFVAASDAMLQKLRPTIFPKDTVPAA